MLLALPPLHGIFLSLSMGKTVTEMLWIVDTLDTTYRCMGDFKTCQWIGLLLIIGFWWQGGALQLLLNFWVGNPHTTKGCAT